MKFSEKICLHDATVILDNHTLSFVCEINITRVTHNKQVRSYGEEMPVGLCAQNKYYVLSFRCVYDESINSVEDDFTVKITIGTESQQYLHCAFDEIQTILSDDGEPGYQKIQIMACRKV